MYIVPIAADCIPLLDIKNRIQEYLHSLGKDVSPSGQKLTFDYSFTFCLILICCIFILKQR